MYSYAQTNIQLFNELPLDVYTSAELRRLRSAYDLSASLVPGHFQASGKPLLSHFVGVASILNWLGAPPPLVTAGLLHAVYTLADFGDGHRGISDAKRRVVRNAVGDEVEAYVARYATMPWGPTEIAGVHARLGSLDGLDRDIVLLRLADHLEHQLDHNVFYHGNVGRREYMTARRDVLVAIAEKLNGSKLADELRRAHARGSGAAVPPELRGGHRAFLIAPRSYRRRFELRVRERLAALATRWRSVVARAAQRIRARSA
jgi:(p)ppGpp synthase/HD superfamily hydrolase